MTDFLIIPGVIIGIWAICKVLGVVGLLISDLWNSFTRR
jgi:hypothetical protein